MAKHLSSAANRARLRAKVEATVLAEIERGGPDGMNKNALAKRFNGRGASDPTVYRWVDSAVRNFALGPDAVRRAVRRSGDRATQIRRARLFIKNINVLPGRLRQTDAAAVERIADSIERLGLRVPISVRETDNEVVLVAGLHRLRAAERLGWETIEVVYCDGDEADARLWEIAENLSRVELLPVQQAEHIAEWVRLTEAKAGDASHVETHEPRKAGQQPGGVNAASRELGISPAAAHRAVKIAELPQETRDQAREEGWTQKRLLEATKPVPPAPVPRNDIETEEAWLATGMRWWIKGSKEWREEFLRRIDGARHT